MAKTRTKKLATEFPVPQSDQEAAEFVRRIGEINREIGRREADLNDQISIIKAKVEEALQPDRDEAEALKAGLETWASAHRRRLTDGGKVKHCDLATGRLLWRLRPPSVTLRGGVEAVIEACRALGFGRFVRVREEIDKDAMRGEPEFARTIPGVSIGSAGEDFVIEPFEIEVKGVV